MAAKAASKTATKTTTKTTTTATKAAPKTVITPDPTPTTTTATTTTSTLGFFDVPTIERAPWGILGLILNIIPGGLGTIIAGAKIGNTPQIIKGVVQFLLLWTGLGWIWSVVDGIRIFMRSA